MRCSGPGELTLHVAATVVVDANKETFRRLSASWSASPTVLFLTATCTPLTILPNDTSSLQIITHWMEHTPNVSSEALINSIRRTWQSIRAPESKEHARQVLFCRLSALNQLVQEVSDEINAVSSTADLPNEVLAKIFMEVRIDSLKHSDFWNRKIINGRYNERWQESFHLADLRWIHLTHVCRNWRRIALGMPELWSDIEIASKRHVPFVERQLELCHGVPISIRAYVNQSTQATISAILSSPVVLQHLQELELTCEFFGYAVVDRLVQSLQRPAPSLQRLCINGHKHDPNWIIQKQFFGGVAPRLRELSLCDCRVIPWNWPPLLQEGLVHLRLRSRFEPATLPTMLQLHSFLTKLPSSLRTLELPNVADLRQPDLPPVSLNALEHLSMVAAGERAPAILRIIRVPPSTQLEITINLNPRLDSSEQFTETVSSIPVVRSSDLNPQQLLIIANPPYSEDLYKIVREAAEHHDFHVCAFDSPQPLSIPWNHVQADSYSIPSPPKLFELNITNARPVPITSRPNDFALFTTNQLLQDGFSLSHLTELYIRSSDPSLVDHYEDGGAVLPEASWAMAARLPCLKLLDLACVDLSILAIYLCQDNASIESILHHSPANNSSSPNISIQPSEVSAPHRLFPKLTMLILNRIHGLSRKVDPGSDQQSLTYLEVILRNVELRKELGVNGEHLCVEFVRCYLEDEQRDRIASCGLEGVILVE